MSVVPLALAGLVFALPPTGGGNARPLHLRTPQQATKAMLGVVWRKDGGHLAMLNPKTLRPMTRRSVALGSVDAWTFQRPDRRVIAVAARPLAHACCAAEPGSVRFVNLQTLKLLPGRIALNGGGHAILWTDPDRLVVVTTSCCEIAAFVQVANPVTHEVVATSRLQGDLLRIRHVGDALVLLQTPHNAIGPLWISVVDATGGVRTVQLDRISGGSVPDVDSPGYPSGKHQLPALAVDPVGYHAYVIQAAGPAAEIDLRSLKVSYHDLSAPRSLLARFSSWLTPAAQAKESTGPRRLMPRG